MATVQSLINQINATVKNYPVEAFHDLNMNSILLQLVGLIVSGGTVVAGSGVVVKTSADFTTAVDCPIPALNGQTINVFWNDTQRFLDYTTQWTDFPGGGFTILIPGFDSTTATFTFYIFVS